MKTIVWQLVKRNLIRYWRDKGALVFSLLSVMIVVFLNILFLADMQIQHIKLNFSDTAGIDELVYGFVLGGLLCIPAVSVPIMLLTFKVDDAAQGTQDDLLITPVSRHLIMLGYVIAAWIAGFVMTLLTFVLGEAFIFVSGGQLLSFVSILKVIAIISVTILVFSIFSFFVIMRLRSNSALTVVNTILNTMIGFLAGLYMPLGFLSAGISDVIKSFPLSHAAALLRQVFMEMPIDRIFGTEPAQIVDQIRQHYGADIVIGGHAFQGWEMYLFLIAFGLVFFVGSVLMLTKYKRRSV